MVKLYAWTTPNGRKPLILLEELGTPYEIRWVNIGGDEQFAPAFLKVSPNNKIPALVDEEGEGGPLSIFESGAILTYLADRAGRFLAPSGPARWKAQEWLHWQIGGLGPMLGQLNFFAKRSEEKAPLAIRRFTEEAERLIGVLDRRLDEAPFLAGEDYSIADMAAYPWMVAAASGLGDVIGHALENASSVTRWMEAVGAREAVQRAMAAKPES
jgi:GSH-dependent disulfide-bond oxidoreductase